MVLNFPVVFNYWGINKHITHHIVLKSTSQILKTRFPKFWSKIIFSMKNPWRVFITRISTHYLNCANITWGSTNKTKLSELMIHPKHTLNIVNSKPQLYHTKELFAAVFSNIFKLNIFNISIFMHKAHYQKAPEIFGIGFEKNSHKYSAKFSKMN